MAIQQHSAVLPLGEAEAGGLVLMGWALGLISLCSFPHILKEFENSLKGDHGHISCLARRDGRSNN
jgi:hypothetical protein